MALSYASIEQYPVANPYHPQTCGTYPTYPVANPYSWMQPPPTVDNPNPPTEAVNPGPPPGPPPPPPPPQAILRNMFGDSQGTREHFTVNDNRYDGEQPPKEIYVERQSRYGPPAPYKPTTWSTPLGQVKPMEATGILKNPWTGEIYETFEEALPPPTTDRYTIPKYQLQQSNPRLVWANGGWDHNKPPPAKEELPGSVFNPVNARGGATVYGGSEYQDDLRAQNEVYTNRDVFNNRNFDFGFEQALPFERPANKYGYNDIVRFNPYIAPTNQLDKKGHMPTHEVVGADLTKREQWTGKFYNRKYKALATRWQSPDAINGVHSVSQIPITTDKPHVNNKGFNNNINGPAHIDAAKGQMLDLVTLRYTTKTEPTLPTAPIQNITSGIVVSDTNVRASLKAAIADNPFRTAPTQNFADAGYVQIDKVIRKENKKNIDPYRDYIAPAAIENAGERLNGQQSTTQRRGTMSQEYIPSVSMIPQDGGGQTNALIYTSLNSQRKFKDTPHRPMLATGECNTRLGLGGFRAKKTQERNPMNL